ncbi:MAG: 6,7-dimethyl-8-ribityllumazine synthase [Acidobacteriota bacterium]
MKETAGQLEAKGLKFAIVVSRFNDLICERLLQGALDVLRRMGAADSDITVIRVPGSFEIPVTAQRLAETEKFQAIICLGALIRGETDHYNYIASQVTNGIGQVALEHTIPVTYGVITADTVEQAMNRAGIKHGNKGAEAAASAVEMANLFKEIDAARAGFVRPAKKA